MAILPRGFPLGRATSPGGLARRVVVAGGMGLALAGTGCPLSDDYFIDSTLVGAGSSSVGGAPSAGSAGKPSGGTFVGNAGSPVQGGSFGATEAGASAAGDSASGGDGLGCAQRTERCNGRDDDCDDRIDEGACPIDCVGFTLSSDSRYMVCSQSTVLKGSEAESACATQDLRLAWIETAQENLGLQRALGPMVADTAIFIGATDEQVEGEWRWRGGSQFWLGRNDGHTVDGAYASWFPDDPNNLYGGQHCAVFNPVDGLWQDRLCSEVHPYLCEE